MTIQPNNADTELENLLNRIHALTADSNSACASVNAPPASSTPAGGRVSTLQGTPARDPGQGEPSKSESRLAAHPGASQIERPSGAPQPAPTPMAGQPSAAPQQQFAQPAPTQHAAAPQPTIANVSGDSGTPSRFAENFQDDGVDRDKHEPFVPPEPNSLREAALTESDVEQLVLKFLFARGETSGREIAQQICLPFGVCEPILSQLKHEQLVAYKDAVQMNDYIYMNTELGRERARRYMQDCSYFGSATVSLEDYIHSVKEQSLTFQNPSQADLQDAFSDLLINQQMFKRLGPAINSGRGMFLFGFPGNGKTSIAERVTQAFGKYIYIPRAIGLHGEVIRVFDPNHHEEAPKEATDGLLRESRVDKRWVRIKRPTIIVGGELTMAQLELQYNANNGTNEAPVQLKSNCGTLVIDDFGRQKMSTDELLNRWIVPLEKRYDFLNMPSGKSVQVPFDQLVIFSTNLEPKDLVDDAFLRRIPYKIEVEDPSEEEFIGLFKIMCPVIGFAYDEKAIRHVIDHHYKAVDRPFRCCQPRDLLLQIRNYCLYQREDMVLTSDRFDFACENYFAVM